MDTFKEVLSFAGVVVGLLTALIPLYARYLDREKRTTQGEPVRKPSLRGAVALIPTAEKVEIEPEVYYEPTLNSNHIKKAKKLVKGPAIALIVAGFLGLGLNLITAIYGYVDAFVTPLSSTSTERKTLWDSNTESAPGKNKAVESNMQDREHDPGTTVMSILMLISFSAACAMAIWAGFNMINLRSYWLSMAGNIANMPGACICCFAGMPIAVWSLTVLLRPEVKSAFS